MPKIVAWLAVDSANHKLDRLNDLDAIVVWTEFGRQELHKAGVTVPVHVVPLGVNLDNFYPVPRDEARATVMHGVPRDAFIIGVVGRNQPRKRLDITFDYFKHFVNRYDVPDAILFLHVAPTGERGFDLQQLVKHHNLKGRVFASIPNQGVGEQDEVMRYIYSSFDVYWSTSQAEGWGLPALEAMACGIPCVLPDFAAFDRYRGWVGDAPLLIPCQEGLTTAPLNGMQYTVGGIPVRDNTIWALNVLHKDAGQRETCSNRGLKVAAQYPWHRTGTEICAILEEVVASPSTAAITESVST